VPLQIERIPTLRDNYTYLLICDQTREAAIVDAPEEAPVMARVEATGVRVTQVLSTHHHPDHSGANPALAARYGVPVIGHPSDSHRLPGFSDPVDEPGPIQVGEYAASVLFIPAHTTGHLAFVFDDPWAVFCGDTLFAAGCGRLFEGTPEMMYQAMRKLESLPDETLVYCGHEYTQANLRFAAAAEPDNEAVLSKANSVAAVRAQAAADWHDATPAEMTIPSTIAEEKATNPFMRAPDAAELGRLRSWKDSF
jgi:hydroxyacylglutathione hydrolase